MTPLMISINVLSLRELFCAWIYGNTGTWISWLFHYLSGGLGSQSGWCGELEVGVEGEGVERGAVVRVSVKGEELVVWWILWLCELVHITTTITILVFLTGIRITVLFGFGGVLGLVRINRATLFFMQISCCPCSSFLGQHLKRFIRIGSQWFEETIGFSYE